MNGNSNSVLLDDVQISFTACTIQDPYPGLKSIYIKHTTFSHQDSKLQVTCWEKKKDHNTLWLLDMVC